MDSEKPLISLKFLKYSILFSFVLGGRVAGWSLKWSKLVKIGQFCRRGILSPRAECLRVWLSPGHIVSGHIVFNNMGVCQEHPKVHLGLLKGGPKNLTKMATNVLEGCDMIHLKGEVHSSVWSTKTFLYDIREKRFKEIKMGYRITKVLNITI